MAAPCPRGWSWPGFRSAPRRTLNPAGLAAAVEVARANPQVDANRVAPWFFSGGSLLMADWLDHTDESRGAVSRALDTVLAALT